MYITINVPEGKEPEAGRDDPQNIDVDYANVVSRQRKFTLEFDRTLAMCVERFNNLRSRSSYTEPVLNCGNSAYNIALTESRLDNLKKEYVSCTHCSNALHYPVRRVDGSSTNSMETDATGSEGHSEASVKRAVVSTGQRSSDQMQDIFLYPTHNIIQRLRERRQVSKLVRSDAHYLEVESESNLNDYVVYMVGGRIEEQPLLRSLWENVSEVISFLHNNLYPLLRIFRISILITFVQWLLFIIRVVNCRNDESLLEEQDCIRFGAFSGALLKRDLAVYRFLSSTFFHNSGGHIIISTIMHFRFSSVFERIHGATITLVVYFVSSAYGMLGTCWLNPNVLQANGFAGDWGVAGALLSRYFVFPYLLDREHQHLVNVFVSLLCLLFAKTIAAVTKILLWTHLLSALAGFCLGSMINNRLQIGRCCGLSSLLVDFLCSFTLLLVPVGSIFALSLIETG
ncbi:uncharacterized protein BXIN_0048 [Babesia sp. Xinjiang]|uniref:uncharacterized protein n=1 Tax=Babesia sp. Xinjiang TaxID=462227 RepID=UPI000A245B21|nr:uncharacterized protein BXIN_0048 [Babesia sp. Xinjiang]ORM39716.1 hypothetical protein BXIN_0048 [Babesia sp. Xinjiang]